MNRSITVYPCAKVNLGLNITEKRTDGYHNLETVFYPVPIFDKLVITETNKHTGCNLSTSGISIEGNPQDNIVVKAYNAISKQYDLPGVDISLEKNIPTQAGMGGGSADCAFTLKALSQMFCLDIHEDKLRQIAAKLGADCAFFISPTPSYAIGIGEILSPAQIDLSNYWMVVVKCDIAVSTREAFSGITPQKPARNCRDIVLSSPISEWKDSLTNDFEKSIFKLHPMLEDIKESLYAQGAIYASMSGSGSAMYGLFSRELHKENIDSLRQKFNSAVYTMKMQGFTDNAEELLPIINENGDTVGSIPRAEAHNGSKILHPVVHLHVFDKNGNLFLQKRPAWKDIQPGKWDTSVGGHIGYGESTEKALAREAKEELGIKEFAPERLGSYIFESDVEKEYVNVFATKYEDGINPSEKELDGGRFWTKDEILSAIGKNVLTPNFENEYKKFFL